MAGKQLLALMLIFGFSYAIAKNYRKVLIFLGALAMTAVCFGVYSIVETVRGDLDPAGVQIGNSGPSAQPDALQNETHTDLTKPGPADTQAGRPRPKEKNWR